MKTRRSPKFSSLIHFAGLFGVTTLLALAGACDSGDDGDDDEAADDGDGDGNDTADTADGNDTADTAEGNDDSSEACDGACANLESCGFPSGECLAVCTSDACATCLTQSDSCGQDCAEACAPGSDTGDGDGDTTGETTGDGDGDTGVPEPECVLNSECGISFECVACGLTDNEGWCVQSTECSFDDDCGIDGKCGYNVETSDYRCLPEAYCP